METLTVEVLVIGWGKGGKTLAGALGRQGRTVAMVEQSNRMYGGSCINIACVPTKRLVHSAELRRDADDPQQWFSAAVAGRDALIDKLRARNHAMLDDIDAVTLIDGQARFIGPHEVEVSAGEDRLLVRAETIVINTGTEPARPPIPGIATSARVHDSTTIQHVDPLPRRLLIVGGGYVGLEFAGMFAGFGSRPTLVDRNDRFMPDEDRDIADAARELLEASGVEVLLETHIERVDDLDGAAIATLVTGTRTRDVSFDAVLIATGRRPVTDGLGLDAAGVEVDDRGFVIVDERLRTSAPGVFAVGDVNGGPQFTYISLDDNRIVMSQLAGSADRTTADRVAVPSTMFLTPPLARVGMNETDARASGRALLIASKRVADIAAMPRPKIVEETHGIIKVIVDAASDLVLGATVFSIDAQEVINLIALAMRAGVTATQLRDGIWTHPSSTEALNEVLAELRPLT
jgi:pyruvate/2-oxoglutarate dehydrogenase complex dihydrolipoamide dehydrogenase (E3) component